jgi:hypothetical protein
MGTQPPPARRGLVHRAAHEGVPEAEAAGNVGGPDQIEPQKLVDCVHRLSL